VLQCVTPDLPSLSFCDLDLCSSFLNLWSLSEWYIAQLWFYLALWRHPKKTGIISYRLACVSAWILHDLQHCAFLMPIQMKNSSLDRSVPWTLSNSILRSYYFIDRKVIWIMYSWRCDDVNLWQTLPIITHFILFKTQRSLSPCCLRYNCCHADAASLQLRHVRAWC
jgi:hypothetical protein